MLDTDSYNIIQTSADYYGEKLNNNNGSYEDLVKEVAGIDVYGNGSAFLMTKEGDILYHAKYKNGISFDDLPPDEQEHFTRILGFEKDTALWHDCIDNVHAKIVIKELDNGLLFGITVPQREIAIPQIRLVIQLFFTSVIIVVVSIFVGLFWVMSIVKPLKKMTEVADRYANGDYSEKMTIWGTGPMYDYSTSGDNPSPWPRTGKRGSPRFHPCRRGISRQAASRSA